MGNILDLPDLRAGEQYGTYAYRLLGRRSTKPLRLMEIYWTGNDNPHDAPPPVGMKEVMEKVGFPRRWPLITRVELQGDGKIAVRIEEGYGESTRYLCKGDQITVEVA